MKCGGDTNQCAFVSTFGRPTQVSKLMYSKLPMYDVTKSGTMKELLSGQDRQADFNAVESEKFADVGSDSTLRPTFKTLPLIRF